MPPPTRPKPSKSLSVVQLDDKLIHIVKSQEEADELARKKAGDGEVFWRFHGSPEHLELLKQASEQRSAKLREIQSRHPEVAEQLDRIRGEMDELSQDINNLTVPANLQATFTQSGYDAEIREPPQEGEEEGDFTDDPEKGDARSTKSSGSNHALITLFKRPVVRQYWHNGHLYRAQQSDAIASCELFVDLVYVGVIAFNGDKAMEDPTGETFLLFCVTFVPSFRIWTDISSLISTFETDDTIQRMAVLLIIACLVGFTTNIFNAFWNTYSQLIAFYLAARITHIAIMIGFAICLPKIRPIMMLNIAAVILPLGLWIASIFASKDNVESLIWVAITMDLWGSGVTMLAIRWGSRISKRFDQKVRSFLSYYPAVNVEHRTERLGAFISLVFGYSVVSLLYQNQATFGMNAFFGKAILGLIQAYNFNTLYFDIDGANHEIHAIRRHALSSTAWITTHLPLIMAYTLSAASMSYLVVAHDCGNADPETLADTSRAKSQGELESGLRWYYCGGLGVALLCMAAISAAHSHKAVPGERIPKPYRLVFRVLVSISWVLLPLAKNLNSLQLMSITTGMISVVLIVDVYGSSCSRSRFIGGGRDKVYASSSAGISRVTTLADGKVEDTSFVKTENHNERGLFGALF